METFRIDRTGLPTIDKVPSAALDYGFDWTEYLDAVADVIASHEVIAPAGITKTLDVRNDKVVTAWLAGGMAGRSYLVRCKVTTTEGRTDERAIVVRVVSTK